MEFTSIENELFFKNVYEKCYENLPFFKKTIIEFDINFETLFSIYKSLFSKNSFKKLKLEGGRTNFGFPCLLTPEYIDSLLYGNNKTEDEKIKIRKKYYKAMVYVLLFVIVTFMLYFLLTSKRNLNEEQAKFVKKQIENEFSKCSKDPLVWSEIENVLYQMKINNCKIEYYPNDQVSYNDYLKNKVQYVFEFYKSVPSNEEVFNSLLLQYTTFNDFFKLVRNLERLGLKEIIYGLGLGLLFIVWTVWTALINILDFFGLCYEVLPTQTNQSQVTNQLRNISDVVPTLPPLQPLSIEPQRQLQITNSEFDSEFEFTKTPTKSTKSSNTTTPLSLAQTPPSRINSIPLLTELTPPPSPSRRSFSPSPSRIPSRIRRSIASESTVLSGLRQRRRASTTPTRLRGGLKKSYSYLNSRKRKHSKRKLNSKSIKKIFNLKRKSDDLLTFFYENLENLTSTLSGGLKKGYLCSITSFGATILFLTLIIFFIKISYESYKIDKNSLSDQLKIFISKVPFFKKFSRVLLEPNGSFTTFFYNIIAYANKVAFTLPPIGSFLKETLTKEISFINILKLLAFAFEMIVYILSLKMLVLPIIKKLMELFQEILCNDDSKTINDTFEFKKIELIEESTKLINNTNVMLSIQDVKPRKTRTKIIL